MSEPFVPARAKLVVIVGPMELAENLALDLKAAGAGGYTVTRADGHGTHGPRRFGLLDGANVRIETLVSSERAAHLLELIEAKHADDAIVAYALDVDAVPRRRFT